MINFIKKNRFISLILSIVSLTTVYVAGIFLSSTQCEKIAEYATDVVVNHTQNKKYTAITVEASEDSGNIADSTTEFHQLYGVFRQEKITFASGMNIDKKHEIFFENSTERNLSVLYTGALGTVEYKGHYKHYISPIEVMFPDERNFDINKYLVYISQSQADNLLDNDPNFNRNADGRYNKSDYSTLLKKNYPFLIDGTKHDLLIQNIYLETNYYFEGLKEVMGDFVISSYYFPNNLRSEQQNIYFLSEYTYQNNFFMDYINKIYPSKKYSVKINHYNIVGEINDEYLLSFYYSDQIYEKDRVGQLLFVLSGIILVLSALILFWQNDYNRNRSNFWIVLNLLVLIVPYLIFKIVYSITNNVSYLSSVSGKVYFWFVFIFVLIRIFIPVVMKVIDRGKYYCFEDFYETNI